MATKAPEWFYKTTIKEEGGLSKDPNDTAKNGIAGVKDKEGKDAEYHTNMGITYGSYKKLAKKVYGVDPSYDHFISLTKDDARKFIDSYWQTSGAQYIKDDRVAALYAHSMWGGYGGKAATYTKDLADIVERLTGKTITRKGLKKETFDAINSMDENQIMQFVDEFHDYRMSSLKEAKTWKQHGAGWTKREERLRDEIKSGQFNAEGGFITPRNYVELPKLKTKKESLSDFIIDKPEIVNNKDLLNEQKTVQTILEHHEKAVADLEIAKESGDLEAIEKANVKIAQLEKDKNEAVNSFAENQAKENLKLLDRDLKVLRRASQTGELTSDQIIERKNLLVEVEKYGIDKDDFWKRGLQGIEVDNASIKRNKLIDERESVIYDKNLSKGQKDIKVAQIDKQIKNINKYLQDNWIQESSLTVTKPGLGDVSVKNREVQKKLDVKNPQVNIDYAGLAKEKAKERSIAIKEENEKAIAKHEEEIQFIEEGLNQSLPAGETDAVDDADDTKKDGADPVDLGTTRKPFIYEPEPQTGLEKMGGWEGVLTGTIGAIGMGQASRRINPPEPAIIDQMLTTHIATVKRLQEIGMPLAEQAQMREALDTSFNLARIAIVDAANNNRGQALAGLSQMSAERQKGALMIEAQKSQQRMGHMKMYGDLMQYVNEFSSKQATEYNRQKFELDKLRGESGALMGAAGIEGLLQSISNAKEFGKGSIHDWMNQYMKHEMTARANEEGEDAVQMQSWADAIGTTDAQQEAQAQNEATAAENYTPTSAGAIAFLGEKFGKIQAAAIEKAKGVQTAQAYGINVPSHPKMPQAKPAQQTEQAKQESPIAGVNVEELFRPMDRNKKDEISFTL